MIKNKKDLLLNFIYEHCLTEKCNSCIIKTQCSEVFQGKKFSEVYENYLIKEEGVKNEWW